jgi:hypothetical protein
MKVFYKFIDHDEMHGSNLDFLKNFVFCYFSMHHLFLYKFLIIDRGDLYFFSHVTWKFLNIYWSWWNVEMHRKSNYDEIDATS